MIKEFGIGWMSGIFWFLRIPLYLMTAIVLGISLALSTTVVGILVAFVLLLVWVNFYEWFHKKHDEMRMRPHKETFLMNCLVGCAGGSTYHQSGPDYWQGPEHVSHTDTMDAPRR